MRDRPHNQAMSEQLHVDPAYAAELLAEVPREGSLQSWLFRYNS